MQPKVIMDTASNIPVAAISAAIGTIFGSTIPLVGKFIEAWIIKRNCKIGKLRRYIYIELIGWFTIEKMNIITNIRPIIESVTGGKIPAQEWETMKPHIHKYFSDMISESQREEVKKTNEMLEKATDDMIEINPLLAFKQSDKIQSIDEILKFADRITSNLGPLGKIDDNFASMINGTAMDFFLRNAKRHKRSALKIAIRYDLLQFPSLIIYFSKKKIEIDKELRAMVAQLYELASNSQPALKL